MFRFTLFVVALFALFSIVLAAPVEVELEKRTTHTGQGTYYYPGLGNCGWTNDSNDMIVAMSKEFYDNNNGGNCGQSLTITWGGKSVTAKMVDSCPGCSYGSLDMSPAVFKKFASLDKGVLSNIKWHFNA
ncbi:hypothetical protein PENSPDRAFT_574126 [Peniophora sp. CONT]|nr:hypothetical protein PENSPDRAFT_574126 [Peniophora sp. CONT]